MTSFSSARPAAQQLLPGVCSLMGADRGQPAGQLEVSRETQGEDEDEYVAPPVAGRSYVVRAVLQNVSYFINHTFVNLELRKHKKRVNSLCGHNYPNLM